MVSNSDIVKLANNYGKYVQKYKKTPETIKTGNLKYTYAQCIYLFSKFIQTPAKKNMGALNIKPAPKSDGDKISEKIVQADYIKMAQKFIKYAEQEKRAPNYITTVVSKKKVSIDLFGYALTQIIVFYYKNKKLPKTVTINSNLIQISKPPAPLNSYLTEHGCSGMGQCTGYYCACNSLQQSFYRLTGIKVPESTIAEVAGTTTAGTSHYGIETAVAWFNRKYNQNIDITWKNFSDLGSTDTQRWNKISELIQNGAVFCHLYYRNQWGHYEVIKEVSDILYILNSLGDSCGGESYCGYIEERYKATQKEYMAGISQKSIAILTRG